MATLTLRLPDDKHQRLRALAQSRHITLNHLPDDMATVMLADSDAETRFKLRQASGARRVAQGLAWLDTAVQSGPPQATQANTPAARPLKAWPCAGSAGHAMASHIFGFSGVSLFGLPLSAKSLLGLMAGDPAPAALSTWPSTCCKNVSTCGVECSEGSMRAVGSVVMVGPIHQCVGAAQS